MVEFGKRDMLDRNNLSMESFQRNASHRCFDMAQKCMSDTLINRILAQLFELLEQGAVNPIGPVKTFSFDDIASAFGYIRSANHIGKIVISNPVSEDVRVPIRAAPKKLVLSGRCILPHCRKAQRVKVPPALPTNIHH